MQAITLHSYKYTTIVPKMYKIAKSCFPSLLTNNLCNSITRFSNLPGSETI